jgi:multisubunit Na+/H+ antiporter MnhF subunit
MTADNIIPQSTLDTPVGQITGLIVGLIFLAAAVVAIIRIVRGPSILDRMIATDALLATIMCALGGMLAFTGRTDLLPVMLVISMFGFVGAVGVSRYVSRADLRTTSRYRRLDRIDHSTGSIGTIEGVEPGVPESRRSESEGGAGA